MRAATPAHNTNDIAVIDRAIAAARPGEDSVKFGDVGMRISDLKVFRDRLAARISESGTDHGTVEPQAATPPGTAFKWPGGNVYYRFDPNQVPNTISSAKMQAFRDGVAEWAAFANLNFIEITNVGGVAHYITVQQQSGNEGGFSSSVGMDPNHAEQFVQFGPNSWNRGTICHEVGHALGLYHEQQRDDRDTYVVINFNNIDPALQANFTKLPGGSIAQGPYDFYSVMHYRRDALSNNGQDTIDPQAPYSQFLNIMGQVFDRTLSKLDRAGMAQVYGNPATLPSAIVTNTNDSGPGTLRTAIYYAFDKSTINPPASTTVTFQIPTTDLNFSGGVFTIAPSYLLVSPGAGTTIDGNTQTAFTGDTNANGPEIVIDGSRIGAQNLGLVARGFILREINCSLQGLVIKGFNQQGVVLDGTAAALNGTASSGNVISGCYIGTDKTGSVAIGNGTNFPGIELFGGAHHNTIGGLTAAARNIISGNTGHGIAIHDAATNNNSILGNYIGTNAAGTAALANSFTGIAIYGGAQSNTIGGSVAGARNVLSGNKRQGFIFADAGTNGNSALGNYIGLNAAGNAAVANGVDNPGIHSYYSGASIFNGAQNNSIGGSPAGSGNVISGNAAQGITISNSGTTGNVVAGNLIGTNPAGSAAIANGLAEPPTYVFGGVAIYGGAQANTIGGTGSGAGNLVSGNGSQGIFIGDFGTNGNVVQGNLIGTNITGNGAIPNDAGVGIFNSASFNTVGGTTASARNVISGNNREGVAIGGIAAGQSVGPTQNTVLGNYIGLIASGTDALGNSAPGVSIFSGAQSNTVGGNASGARNVISGNALEDVAISGTNSNANTVLGNIIGLDSSGTIPLLNNNSGVGIFNGAQNNIIGGTSGGSRNFISGHAQYGIFIADAGTTGNLVQGNTIGLNTAGSGIANNNPGVAFFNSAQSNTLGGSSAGASNIISGNANEGVAVYSSNSTTIKDALSRNSIFANGGKGIALYNGGNNSTPFPTILSAVLSTAGNPNGVDVSGSMAAAANTTYMLEFFASTTGDASGFGEGQFFVGAVTVGTNGAGSANFSSSLAAAVPAGYVITATATDPSGSTSEFSATRSVATTDTDGDGIPDAWMSARFGHATGQTNDKSRASDDADGDGMTNLQEFKAGTDPRSANSMFRISSVVAISNDIQVNFPSVSGKTYRLEYRNDLTAGGWNTLVDQIFGTGGSVQVVDGSAKPSGKRFYRLSIEP